jgi:iron complex transport system substrate-binding protein
MRVLLVLLAAGLNLIATMATAAGFPVIVKHSLGETNIAAAPQRIVSLGFNDQDFLYALGVSPVGVHEWWGAQPYATWPWAEPRRLELGAAPQVLTSSETNLEWVAAQRPDLIVATYYDLDHAMYDQLSKIAPVVAAPAGYAVWQAPWQEQLKLLDQATSGNTAKAEAIVAGLDARTTAVKDKYPAIVGKTGAVADFRDGQFTLWNSGSAPSRFLLSFGMVFPEALDKLADDTGWIRLSPELIEMIDLDAVVWPIDSPTSTKQADIEAMSLYQTLRMPREGRSVWLDDGKGVLASALWFQSPLSIAYVLDKLPPMLAAAVDGDPATAAKAE